jgi:hypothetical protein
MAVAYSGGTIQNVLFTQSLGTKQELINEIETVLLAAGWTTISGHATTSLLMQSAATPQGLQMRLKVKDNAATCITLSILDITGTYVGANTTTAGGQLLPVTSKSWRIIANQYQAFIFNNTAGSSTAARDYVAFGVTWIPASLSSLTIAIWLQASGGTDTDTNTSNRTLRDWLINNTNNNTGTNLGWQSTITNTTVAEGASTGSCAGVLAVGQTGGTDYGAPKNYRFQNGDIFVIDPWVFWGPTGTSSEGQCMGMLWDAFVVTDSIAGNSVSGSYTDGSAHTAFAVTNNNTGTPGYTPRGTVCLVIT